MKKALIMTIYGNMNYGNKLQNYAVYKLLKDRNIEVLNLKNNRHLNYKRNIVFSYMKFILSRFKYIGIYNKEFGLKNYLKRLKKFKQFASIIPTSKEYFNYARLKKYQDFDYLLVGSDQVWNPNMCLDDLSLFKYFKCNNKISISASIALSKVNDNAKNRFRNNLNDFKAISVREYDGKKILEECTNREDIEVLIDPTMMIKKEEWEKLSKKPNIEFDFSKKYILLYFLGTTEKEFRNKIEEFAKKNNCEIIDIYNKKDKWITCGPSEFLFLEKNAELICTDSFHSAVFGILFNRPILVTGRNGSKDNMNSRIDTLLTKFKLKNSRYDGNINNNILDTNFIETNEILEKERNKATIFLDKALKIKDGG